MAASKDKSIGLTVLQKRAYLAGLSPSELISIILYVTELHPDLPIFPADDNVPVSSMQRSFFAGSTTEGLFSRAEAAQHAGPINFIRKVSVKGSAASSPAKGKGASVPPPPLPQQSLVENEDDDPTGMMDAWPKPGNGLYTSLASEWADEKLVDKNDFESFSHLVFDKKGNKIEENGIAVPAG